MFEYRKLSPGGLQVQVAGRGRRRFGRSSAEDQQQDQPHRRERTKEGSSSTEDQATVSTTSTGEDQGRIIVCRGSAAGSNTSTEEDQNMDLHLQRLAAGSTTSTEEDQGRMFVCKDQQQNQPLHRRSNSGQLIQRIKRICIRREAAPMSSTSTDTRW